MDPSDDYKWFSVGCADLDGAVPVCEYPHPPDDTSIAPTTDCLMLPSSTSGWHSPAGAAANPEGCADLCRAEATDATPFQWGVFKQDGEECFCRLHVEQGTLRTGSFTSAYEEQCCCTIENVKMPPLLKRLPEL